MRFVSPRTVARVLAPASITTIPAGPQRKSAMAYALASVLSLVLAPQWALAQQAPQVTPRDLRPDTPVAPAAAVPLPAPAAAPDNAQTLFVQVADVTVENGFPQFAGQTDALSAQVRGRRLAVAEFYKLAEAIEALYRTAGFALVRVTVPPQNINDGGTLKLIVVDGFIEKVDVSGVAERARGGVQAAMRALVGKRQLRSDDLERALTLASRGPGVSLRSTLGAGQAVGGVVLVLEGTQILVSGSAAADNRLSDQLGPWQTNLQGSLNQALGYGEQLYVQASSGADLNTAYRGTARRRVLGAGVILPLNVNGLSFNAEYTRSDSAPRALPFTPITRSEFERYSTRITYPLLLNRAQELTLTGVLDATTQRSALPDFGLEIDHDRLRVVRVGLAWNRAANEGSTLSAGATLSKGMNGLGARTQADAAASETGLSRPGANPAFAKLDMNLTLQTALPRDIGYRLRVQAQMSLHGVLPGAELFSLDGEDALSAYTAGSLSDDGGITVRQELSRQVSLEVSNAKLVLAPYAFIANGKAYSKIAGPSSSAMLHAYGVGVQMAWGKVGLSMEYGRRRSEQKILNGNEFFVKAQVQL